jgi:hypothetical protein
MHRIQQQEEQVARSTFSLLKTAEHRRGAVPFVLSNGYYYPNPTCPAGPCP